MLGAERAWRELGANGQGVVVATIDSGADWLHPALRTSYRGLTGRHDYSWMDFSRPGSPRDRPGDGNGHGTQVLGVIAGGAVDRPMGVAPGAEWITARAFDTYGFSTDRRLLRAAEWLLAPTRLDGSIPRPDLAPDVVSCSWVLENGVDPLFEAVIQAWRAAGILPVFAAGNSDDGTRTAGGVLAPASSPNSIAVGALRPSGAVWDLSKGGPSFLGHIKPDVVAPGVDVLTARAGGGTIYGTGTSMAAPHAAGTAALMLSASPGLGVSDLAYGLRATARDLGTPGPDNSSGWGAVDALGAAEWSLRSGRVAGRVTDRDGAPVGGAIVRLAFSRSGVVPDATTLSHSDGTYSVAVAPGSWIAAASALRYLDETADVEVVPELTTALDLRLRTAPQGKVTGQIAGVFGQPLAGAGVELLARARAGSPGGAGGASDTGIADDPVVLATSGADGRYELHLSAGTHELRYSAHGHRAESASVEVEPSAETVGDVSLAAAPRILLVDADAYTGERVHPYFDEALRRRGYEADVWSIEDPLVDLPETDDLAAYEVVIWLHVYGSPGRLDARRGDTAASSALETYVGQGGRLIISGQDIGRHDSADTPLAGAAAPDLYSEVLGARYIDDDAGSDLVRGFGWLDGLELDLDSPGGRDKGARLAPDVVAPASDGDGGETAPVLRYPDGRGAALAVDSASGRRVYLAFGPEGIGDLDGFAALYDRLIGWLEAPRMTLRADPVAVRTGGSTGLRVTLRAARATLPGELELLVPPKWTVDSHPSFMARVSDDRVVWDGFIEAGSNLEFDVGARLVGPAAGAQPQVFTSTLRSLGRTQVITTAVNAVAPDLDPSQATTDPGRITGRSSVEYVLSIANSGTIDATDAEARVLLPAAAQAVTDTLRASSGAVEWESEGPHAVWRGAVRPDEMPEMRFSTIVAGAPGSTHAFTARIDDGLGRIVTRTAEVLAGGPDLRGSSALPLPAVALAGHPLDLVLRLDNSGATRAVVRTTVDLPHGIEAPGASPDDDGALGAHSITREDLVEPGATRSITVPLLVDAMARSGPRVIGIALDDNAKPPREVRLEAATVVRRAELDGSRTLLLPDRVRSGEVVTATVLVSNQGDATVPVSVIDSLPPVLVVDPDSLRSSSGEVSVEPGTVRWTVDAPPAGDDYAWTHSPGRPPEPGTPVSPPIQAHTDARGPVSLGFGFPFYTSVYTMAWVTDDGLLSFEPPNPDRASTLGPGGPDVPSVAAMWRPETRGARPSVRRTPGGTTFVWPARSGSDSVGVTLERGGAMRMDYGLSADPRGSIVGLRAPDGHVLSVPHAELSTGWGISFDSPGGWEWLTFSGKLGFALPPNSPVMHTVRLRASGYDRTLTSGVLANRLRLDDSHLDVKPKTPVPGGAVRYMLSVLPEGDVDARDVEVRVDAPATGTVDQESITGGLAADPDSDRLVWRGRIAAGEAQVLGWTVRLPHDVRVGARLVARATVRADGVPATTLTSVARARATDFSGSGKHASHSVAGPGEIVRFVLRAANAGDEPAVVRLIDALPPGLTYVDGSARSSVGPEPEWQPVARALSWSGTVPARSVASVHLAARFEGREPAVNAMWLTDDSGTTFADWADVVPMAHAVFLPAAAQSAVWPSRSEPAQGMRSP